MPMRVGLRRENKLPSRNQILCALGEVMFGQAAAKQNSHSSSETLADVRAAAFGCREIEEPSLRREARALVRRHREIIKAVAEQLAARGELSGREIDAMVARPWEGDCSVAT